MSQEYRVQAALASGGAFEVIRTNPKRKDRDAGTIAQLEEEVARLRRLILEKDINMMRLNL